MDDVMRQMVTDLKEEIIASRTESWPIDAPLSFLRGLPPQTVGSRFGKELVKRLLEREGLYTSSGGTRLYDLVLGPGDGLRIEVKTSTETPKRRFQQVRDPRPDALETRWRYDALVCVGISPTEITFWLMAAPSVADLIDKKLIYVQHSDSKTNWFFPNENDPDDRFKEFIVTRTSLINGLKSLRPVGR